MDEKNRLREQIDGLDQRFLEILNERMALVQAICAVKQKEGAQVADWQREESLLSNLQQQNRGPLKPQALRNVYLEILSASRELQRPLGVAFLGPEATFSHMAALKKFGRSASFHPFSSIHEVFSAIEKGKVDYGVVPVENSTEGAVNDTLDHLVASPLNVCGEIVLRISHDLLSSSGQLCDAEVIYTHPQAHGQCRHWLAAHLPDLPVVEVSSTGAAAQKAAKNPNSAAIASEIAAPLYGLKVLEHRIEDEPTNTTQFFLLGNDAPGPTEKDKTSILFAVDDGPGALHQALRPLAEQGINMTRIVSKPARSEQWRYFFFVDMEGHQTQTPVQQALAEIESLCPRFRVLGSFPRSECIYGL